MTGITQNVGISIHAPVKGATAQGGNPALPALNFNPRSREGSDNSGYVRRMNRIYFNPRSREGSDRSILNTTLHNIISIHAPAKGATSAPSRTRVLNNNFNPRSREGSDGCDRLWLMA